MLFRVIFRISNYETSCTQKARDNHFNEGQIMQRIITYANLTYQYPSKISSEN